MSCNCCNISSNTNCNTSNTTCNTSNTTCNTNCIRGPCGPTGPTGLTGPIGPVGPTGTNAHPDLKLVTTDADQDYSTLTKSFNIVLNSSTAIGTGGARKIKLPEPTSTNAGIIVKIILARPVHTTNGVKIGFANSGSSVMIGGLSVISTTGDKTLVNVTSTAQAIDLIDVDANGGSAGTEITLTYLSLNTVAVSGIVTTVAIVPIVGTLLNITGWS
tara:strand:- start:1591 stop:2238 length:648 start_codon:yes stop_codon:yes gene_type:complete